MLCSLFRSRIPRGGDEKTCAAVVVPNKFILGTINSPRLSRSLLVCPPGTTDDDDDPRSCSLANKTAKRLLVKLFFCEIAGAS